jgi:hypothetical protein
MRAFGAVPGPIIAAALLGLALGLPLLFWLLKRAMRSLLGRLQVPIHGTFYVLALLVAVGLLGGALVSVGLMLALRDHRGVGAKAFMAQVRCARVSPGKVRLDYVPLQADGDRGASEVLDLTGDGCSLTGDLIAFQPFLSNVGLGVFARVTSLAGGNPDTPARRFEPSRTLPDWLRLERDGKHPLGYLLQETRSQALTQAADEGGALLNLWATPDGYQLMSGGAPVRPAPVPAAPAASAVPAASAAAPAVVAP